MQDSSIAAWRDAIRADTFVNYHLEMGIVLLEQDPPAAVLHFRKAVDILPQRPDHHLLLVQALTASGKAEDAHAADRAARAAHPDYRSLGLIHMALRQLQNLDAGKAQPLLDAAEREAAEREGERPELRLARFALRCLVETDPGTPAAAASLDAWLVWPLRETLLAIAATRLSAGACTAAAAAAGLAVTLAPDIPSPDGLRTLARAQACLGHRDEAVRVYDMAIASSRLDAALRVEKAQAMEHRVEDIETISGLLAEALRLAPESATVRQARAHFLLWRGAFDQLDSLLDAWRAEKPLDDLGQRLRCLRQLAVGQLDAAIEIGREGIAQGLGGHLLPVYTAFALQGLGRHDEALRVIERALPASNAWVTASHGQILLGAGRTDEAQRRLEDALTAAPTDPWTVTGAALGRRQNGDHAGFANALRHATQLQPLRFWFQCRLRPFFSAALETGCREIGFTETGWWPVPTHRG